MSKWKKQKLLSLCKRIGDGLHGTPTYILDSDIYFINGNNLQDGKIIIDSETKRVTEEVLKSNYVELNQYSLLLSINGTLGSMAFYNGEKVMLGKSAAYLNFKTAINKFYYYYFQLENIQKYFYHVATGSTIKNLSLKSIQDFEVPVPEQNEWLKIAAALSSLDNKIELNNKINAELEAMAKTLYDYWFVQFDFPDENGKPYKSSGGKMVWNEVFKREIPEGWEVKNLGAIENNIITGKTPPTNNSEFYNGDIPFITIGDIRGNMHVVKTEIKLTIAGGDIQKNKFIPDGSLCVTCIASPGLIGFATENSQTNQQINSIIFSEKANRTYLYFVLCDFFKFAKGAKTGNTFANMNKGDFEDILLLNPSIEIKRRHHIKAEAIFDLILNNLKQNQELSSIRDWLLPMLMNGQVSVGEAYEQVEKVLGMVAEPE